MTKPPAISTIICTKNRCKSLAAALESMSRLDLAGLEQFELVVVDNHSSDDTREVVSAFAKAAPFPVLYLFEKHNGLSFARNKGIDAAKGEVIVFTDDDCYVSCDWAKAVAESFFDGRLKIIGGKIELHNKDHLPVSVKTDALREELTSIARLPGFIHGANMAFRRAVIEKVGKFDVRLGAGTKLKAAEDTDFIYRALRHGIPIIYEPGIVVHHDHGRSGQEEWYRLSRDYAAGKGAMMMKHLLRGRGDLAKLLYWEFRSLLRDRRAGVPQQPWAFSQVAEIKGALRFLFAASWKKSE